MKILFMLLLSCPLGWAQLTRQAAATLNFPAELPTVNNYTTQNALGSLTFSNPIATAFPPGETNRLFVVQRGGIIRVVTNLNTTPTASTFCNLSSVTGVSGLTTSSENGLLSMAFHPNYATNGYFYVFYSFNVTEGASTRLFQRIARLRVSSTDPNVVDNASLMPILTIYDEAGNHNGGDLAFGADGYLYISLGDEGGANDAYNNARFINKDFWGQLLRIDVDNLPGNLIPNAHSQASTTFPSAIHPGTYRVPADNPFIGATTWHNLAVTPSTVRTEIYATGLRNPFRFSFDPPTGRLFLGDVGQNAYEEIDLIVKGGDYGWSWREGTHNFSSGPAPTSPPAVGFTPVQPIAEYGRSVGTSITGGEVYRGLRLPELQGAYICADYVSGRIFAVRQTGPTWTLSQINVDTSKDAGITDFGVDPRNGDLIFTDMGSGVVNRLVVNSSTGTAPPATLSATGIFSNTSSLTPAVGMVPYEPNHPYWSDHAEKSRWLGIKNLTDTMTYAATGAWAMPTGMVLVKHFDMEMTRGNPATKRRLETRVLVKTTSSAYGLTYRWRSNQLEADLVAEEGANEVLTINVSGSNVSQTWRYPSRTECRACHREAAGFALSLNSPQLNRSKTYGAVTQNQIAALAAAGYFSAPPENLHLIPALPTPTETSHSLESRVRAYLAVNCANCHHGPGSVLGNWDVRHHVSTAQTGIINGAVSNHFGDPAHRLIAPGDPSHSMILQRLTGLGVPKMPVGILQRDLSAEQVLTEWIAAALPAQQTFEAWQVTHFGGTTGNAAATADPDHDGMTNADEFLHYTTPTSSNPHPSLPSSGLSGGEIAISFLHPANRSAVVEISSDLVNWAPWNVPGNAPYYPAATTPRTVTGPQSTQARFFRVKIAEL